MNTFVCKECCQQQKAHHKDVLDEVITRDDRPKMHTGRMLLNKRV